MKQVGRFGLWVPEDTDAPDGPTQINQLAEGTESSDGLNDLLARAGAQSMRKTIATEQSRTNAAFGVMGTADEIPDIFVPTGALLFVTYFAHWKCSVKEAGRAALFLGANQLKIIQPGQEAAKIVSTAHMDETANIWQALRSCPWGVSGVESFGANLNEAIPNTGYALTGGIGGGGATAHMNLIYNNGGTVNEFAAGAPHPVCVIGGLAEGEYDLSIQFRSASGSVTVKNRTLIAWTSEPEAL